MPLSDLLSESRLNIVNLAKSRGEISIDDAVEELGLAKTTIRQHMGRLENIGILESESRREGRGRPKLVYTLTPTAEGLFPSGDAEIARELVEFLGETGNIDLVEAFFEKFWERRRAEFDLRCQAAGAESLPEKLEVLEELLEEQGFMPDIDCDGDSATIRECNCPFPETVEATRIPCRLEAQFMRWIVGSETDRVEFIPDGAPACTYAFELEEDDSNDAA